MAGPTLKGDLSWAHASTGGVHCFHSGLVQGRCICLLAVHLGALGLRPLPLQREGPREARVARLLLGRQLLLWLLLPLQLPPRPRLLRLLLSLERLYRLPLRPILLILQLLRAVQLRLCSSLLDPLPSPADGAAEHLARLVRPPLHDAVRVELVPALGGAAGLVRFDGREAHGASGLVFGVRDGKVLLDLCCADDLPRHPVPTLAVPPIEGEAHCKEDDHTSECQA
mmetsp:Transcript_29960/g.95610  ORF Transcript_29960/g.95610 Transcript_29960/m.95610 type:complete len:226 (+) Transcript_29960:422-1099(+)